MLPTSKFVMQGTKYVGCNAYWWIRLCKSFAKFDFRTIINNNCHYLIILDDIIYFVGQNQIQCKRQSINGLNAACIEWLQEINIKSNKNHQSRKFLCVFLFPCNFVRLHWSRYKQIASNRWQVVISTFVSMVWNRNFISNIFCRNKKLIFFCFFFP